MKFSKVYSSINYLLSNRFINHTISDKVYVCHYLFSSYFITKDDGILKTALDLFKETLKYAYLRNSLKEKEGFLDTLIYVLSVANSFGIEIEIDEIIKGDILAESSISNLSVYLLECNEQKILSLLKKDFIYLVILFQLRCEIINKENCQIYMEYLHRKYNAINKKELLFCVFMISFFFDKRVSMNSAIRSLSSGVRMKYFNEVIQLTINPKKKCIGVFNNDLISVMKYVNKNERFNLIIIYYTLINGKVKCDFS